MSLQGDESMNKWCCQVCGYVYDAAVGEADQGIAPGTPFESLPAVWACPDCGAIKSNYRKAE